MGIITLVILPIKIRFIFLSCLVEKTFIKLIKVSKCLFMDQFSFDVIEFIQILIM